MSHSDQEKAPPIAAKRSGFETTDWSLVLAASSTQSLPLLNRLCSAYWKPVYTYLRCGGLSVHESEDVTQDFFADMLRREWLENISRERGRFRTFLLVYLRNFLANHRRTEQAQKRGGSVETIPLDILAAENDLAPLIDKGVDSAQAYEMTWASTLLQAALKRLQDEFSGEKMERFLKLRPFLTQSPSQGDYQRLAEEIGINKGQVAVVIHRYSKRFQELIRAEVAATLVDRGQVAEELRHLLVSVAENSRA